MKSIRKSISDFSPGPEPKELSKYLKTIAYWVGYFIFEFNDLENRVTSIAAEHIDGRFEQNVYAYIFLTGMTFNQKVELLERYYNLHLNMFRHSKTDTLREEAQKLISELKEIGKIRNTIVHAHYYSFDQNGNIREKTKFTVSDIEEQWVSITRDFLVENINSLYRLIEKLENFGEKFQEMFFPDQYSED